MLIVGGNPELLCFFGIFGLSFHLRIPLHPLYSPSGNLFSSPYNFPLILLSFAFDDFTNLLLFWGPYIEIEYNEVSLPSRCHWQHRRKLSEISIKVHIESNTDFSLAEYQHPAW